MIQKNASAGGEIKHVKLLISLNKTLTKHIQNNQKSIGKPYQSMDFKNFKKKIRDFCQMFVISKKNHIWKSIA